LLIVSDAEDEAAQAPEDSMMKDQLTGALQCAQSVWKIASKPFINVLTHLQREDGCRLKQENHPTWIVKREGRKTVNLAEDDEVTIVESISPKCPRRNRRSTSSQALPW
jgi:hypothetical protein